MQTNTERQRTLLLIVEPARLKIGRMPLALRWTAYYVIGGLVIFSYFANASGRAFIYFPF